MKHCLKWLSILLLLLGMNVLQASTIQGVVSDSATGNPIEGAIITAFTPGPDPTNPDSIIYTTVSLLDGSYSIENAIPGVYSIACNHPLYHSEFIRGILVNQPNDTVTVDFYLIFNNSGVRNSLSGTVFSSGRNLPVYTPLDGADVRLSGNGMLLSTTSDSGGLYQFTNIPTGLYQLYAMAPNHDPTHLPDSILITNNSIITGMNIVLMLSDTAFVGNSFYGHVYASDSSGTMGPPLHPAIVSLFPNDPASAPDYTTVTNPDGSFLINDIVPGVYHALCEAPQFLPQHVPDVDLSLGDVNLDFYMLPDNAGGNAVLTGIVLEDSTFTPVYPALVSALGYANNGDSLLYQFFNQPDGQYQITGMIPGSYTVWCEAPGYQTEYVHNFQVLDSLNRLDFLLSRFQPANSGVITGSIYSDSSGAPIHQAFLEFISSSGSNYYTLSDINGSYISPNLPVGDYYVACYVFSTDSNAYYMEYYDDVHVLANATVLTVTSNDTLGGIDFGIPISTHLSNVTVSGRVTDNSNTPLQDALVSVFIMPNPGSYGDSLVYQGLTDAQGNYSIELINPSSHFVFSFLIAAEKQGYDIEFWQEKTNPWEADRIWVRNDSDITGIDFTLNANGGMNSINGSISSELGFPLPNAFVIAVDIANGELEFTFTDSVGAYTLPSLNQSNYYLLFAAAGHIPEFYDDVYIWEDAIPVYASGNINGVNADLAVLSLNNGTGNISGTVLSDDHTPLSGVLLAIKNSSGDVVGYDLTDPSGGYEVPGIMDGDYQVSASKVNFGSESQNVVFNSSSHNTLLVNFDLSQVVANIPEKPGDHLPTVLKLATNFPNPFNPETKISFDLPEPQNVRLVIYNVLGQLVSELVNKTMDAGTHTFIWRGTDSQGNMVASGVYFYGLETANKTIVKKMIFSK